MAVFNIVLENTLKPVVGIIGNSHLINDTYPAQTTGLMNIEPIMEICNAISLVVPGVPKNATSKSFFFFNAPQPQYSNKANRNMTMTKINAS